VLTSTSKPSQTCSSRRMKAVVLDARSAEAANWTGFGYGRNFVYEFEATCWTIGQLLYFSNHDILASHLCIQIVPVDPASFSQRAIKLVHRTQFIVCAPIPLLSFPSLPSEYVAPCSNGRWSLRWWRSSKWCEVVLPVVVLGTDVVYQVFSNRLVTERTTT
jgi:hypothetical protein